MSSWTSAEEQLLATLDRIAGELYDVQLDDMTPESRFDELDLDSIEVLEIVGRIEAELNVRIPEERLLEIVTIRDLARFIADNR